VRIVGVAGPDVKDDVVLVNGVPAELINGVFVIDLSGLEDGPLDITVVAEDLAGNVGKASVRVLIDTKPPQLSITEPIDGAYINRTSVRVAGTAGQDVKDERVLVNGILVTLYDGGFEIELTGLEDGLLEITVAAEDLAGNAGEASVMVFIDTTPPDISLSYPVDGLLTNESRLTVSGQVEGASLVWVQGKMAPVIAPEFQVEVELQEGLNYIIVEAWDDAGNNLGIQLSVVLDTTPPRLVIHGLENATLTTERSDITIEGSTEPGAYLTMTVLGMPFEVPIDANGHFTFPLTLEVSVTEVHVTAVDDVGNQNTTQFIVEWTVPTTPETPTAVPVEVWVAGTVGVVVALAALAGIEATRYSILVLLAPLFTKLAKEKVLDHKIRYGIQGLIIDNPGVHYSAIIREFDLPNGVAAYHLSVLEREGYIRSVRDGMRKRFYSSAAKVPKTQKLTPEELRELAAYHIRQRPGLSQKEISDELGISRDSTGYHLRELVKNGKVQASRKGKNVIYHPQKRAKK
jgi:DNA-binding transcriptional ArsR family regulator